MRRKNDSVKFDGLRWEVFDAAERVQAWLRADLEGGRRGKLGDRWHPYEVTITSGSEKTARHGRTSLHYAGAALDLRSRDWLISDEMKAELCEEYNRRLGPDIDLVFEATLTDPETGKVLRAEHVHIEWQPKRDDELLARAA